MGAKKAKRGPGKPSKGREALTTNFIFKVSEVILERLVAAAAKAGKPVTVWVREVALRAAKRAKKG